MRSLALAALLLPLTACATNGTDTDMAKSESEQPVNALCPLMEEPVDPAFQTMWQGRRVGFCCEDCMEEWAGMSDAERQSALDAVER